MAGGYGYPRRACEIKIGAYAPENGAVYGM